MLKKKEEIVFLIFGMGVGVEGAEDVIFVVVGTGEEEEEEDEIPDTEEEGERGEDKEPFVALCREELEMATA